MIVCGLRGAGKTTLARALDIYDEETRGKTEAPQWKLGRKLLALDLTVSVEWGTWGRSERDALRLGARALAAAVELHYLSASLDVFFERIQRRGLEKPPIERDAISRWFEMFQAPTPEEMATSLWLWSWFRLNRIRWETRGLFAGPVGNPVAAAWSGIASHVWCGEGFRVRVR